MRSSQGDNRYSAFYLLMYEYYFIASTAYIINERKIKNLNTHLKKNHTIYFVVVQLTRNQKETGYLEAFE